MNRRVIAIIGIIVAIPAIGLAYWLGSPLFREDSVEEDIPDNIVIISAEEYEETRVASGDDMIEVMDDDVQEDTSVEARETQVAAASTDNTVSEDMPEDMTTSNTEQEDTSSDNSDQVTAVEIKRGEFRDADGFHQGSGTATIFQLSDGRHLLRFENFSVTNGPGLRVYLVPSTNDGANVTIQGYTDLGVLKGNTGPQNYFIDAGVDIPENASILIWCEPFSVLFSVASLN